MKREIACNGDVLGCEAVAAAHARVREGSGSVRLSACRIGGAGFNCGWHHREGLSGCHESVGPARSDW